MPEFLAWPASGQGEDAAPDAAPATIGYPARMADLSPLPQLPPGRYRHYKGNDYEVVAVVRHSETLEALVLYRALYGEGGLWVRPYAMFVEPVLVEGRAVPRFAPVDGAP